MKQRVKKKIIFAAIRRKIKPFWLVKSAIHMKPLRVVIGEIANPEALDILKVMNTGHIGSLNH
ncbi:ATPase, T2SS/T4P/T4SS family [Undibacterium sp.]|uniref:ATPase, T2SS/T4P/T4SS family n=1 Tax=Undibacterium sp. TaxID=1914977 RepID=UPI00374FFA2F